MFILQTPIIASIYTSGRSDENFSKPNLFLPYRWDKNDQQAASLINHKPSASLPFAMGARSCIGKKMAMIQLTEVVNQVNTYVYSHKYMFFHMQTFEYLKIFIIAFIRT